MEFLRREGKYKDAPRPDMILLDLNMPRMDGSEVLTEVKKDPKLRSIPVIILATSDAEIDIIKSYDLFANCYITKPVDFEKLIDVVKQIENFWVSIVQLPSKKSFHDE
jgi:CheY-like chemotaxis protein